MTLIFLLLSFWWVFGYKLIAGTVPDKNIYISSKLSSSHQQCIENVVDYYNTFSFLDSTVISPNYDYHHDIRISYYDQNDPQNRLTASTSFTGILLNDNTWSVSDMEIKLNKDIQHSNLCEFLMLHEILHTKGLYHSLNPYSFMNQSVFIRNEIVQDTEKPYMGWDDIAGLLQLQANK